MLDKSILIKNLEDFKNTKKYPPKQLAEFLSKNPVTTDFYKLHVEKFKFYLSKYTRTIIKYSKEHHDYLHLSYTAEEIKIIRNIIEEHLVEFWTIDMIQNGLTLLNCRGTKLRFAIDIYDEKEKINDLIDYIIKFCIIPYTENKIPGIKLTKTERSVLEKIHKGLSVPEIADELDYSKLTVENIKKNICKKIDDLNSDEYKNKKALAKLHLLAQKIFK